MMARQRRLDVPHGTYYVVQSGSAQQRLFTQPEHFVLLEELLASVLRRTGTHALAYCWLPDSIHLALQMGSVPLGRFMQGFTSRYARSLHLQLNVRGHLFAHRYRSLLIDPECWLLPLIHYVHSLPVLEGLVTNTAVYEYSSHQIYLGITRTSWIHTRAALRSLAGRGEPDHAYRELMAQPPTPEVTRAFRQAREDGSRSLASPGFLARLPRSVRTPRSALSFEQLVHQIAVIVDVDHLAIFSRSSQQALVLARALIAWHATERGIASLSEVGRRLRRHPSTLSSAIAHHRNRRPDLFQLNALHYFVPLG